MKSSRFRTAINVVKPSETQGRYRSSQFGLGVPASAGPCRLSRLKTELQIKWYNLDRSSDQNCTTLSEGIVRRSGPAGSWIGRPDEPQSSQAGVERAGQGSLRCCARRLASSNRLAVLAGCRSDSGGEAVSAAAPASGCVGMASFLVGMRMTGVWGWNKSGSGWTAGAVCLART